MDMHPLSLRFGKELENRFYEEYFARSLRQVRIAILLGLSLYMIFGLLDHMVIHDATYKTWTLRYVVVCPIFLAGLIFTYFKIFKRYMQVTLTILVFVSGFGITALTVIAPPPANHLYWFGMMLVLMYSYTFIKLRFIYATIVSWTIGFIDLMVAVFINSVPIPFLLSNIFFFISASCIGMTACYTIELYNRKDYLQRLLLREEQEKSERLLLNILPKSIADRLKGEHQTIAEGFAEATVLFADIVGFTNMSTHKTPDELVAILNELFSQFDGLVERHDVEKIKTIGDAYMVAAGLPVERDDHAEAIAEMALDMRETVSKFNKKNDQSLHIRVGINTGPVVAGVIGTKKFIYDLWGDTVNTASRMESHSSVDGIQVTEATYERLRHKYVFSNRGLVEVKGKGEMQTYMLVGRRVGNDAVEQKVAS